jgi:hypothetical protein
MEQIVTSIKHSLEAQLWMPALALALAVPDICSQIEYPEMAGAGFTGKRYPKWFECWVKEKLFRNGQDGKEFPMSGEDCYAFRNAFLHVGEAQLQKSHKANYKIIKPTAGNLAHMTTQELLGKPTVLLVGTAPFCNAVCDGAIQWREDVLKRRPEAQPAIERLLTIVNGEVTVASEHAEGQWAVRSVVTFR